MNGLARENYESPRLPKDSLCASSVPSGSGPRKPSQEAAGFFGKGCLISKRVPLSKRKRFEIFKRDSFKCVYCNRGAPDVILHVDHIKPVISGGTNHPTNLVTSCADCNLGKGAVPLDDNSSINKQRQQLEELQARHEQLEMMMRWREGLKDILADATDKACAYLESQCPGGTLNEFGRKHFRKLVRKYGVVEVCDAIDVAVENYVTFEESGKATDSSVRIALTKLGGILHLTRLKKENPDHAKLFYARGILRNRFKGEDIDWRYMSAMKQAVDAGMPVTDIIHLAKSEYSLYAFKRELERFVMRAG